MMIYEVRELFFLKKIHADMMDFAIQNPDSSAVQKFFTPPPMPKF